MLTRKTWEDGTWKDELRQIAEGANAQNQMLVYDVMPAGQFDPSTTENKTRGYQTFTDEELLEQIQLIKSVLKTELLLELGNEQYALQFAKYFPAVYDYAKWANDFAGKVKAFYPEVQAYGCLIDTRSEDNICADSGNFNGYEDDGAYTQGWRVAKWNQAVVDNSSNIDGYTIHPYIGFPEANGVGEKFTLENNYKGQYTMEKTLLETYEIAGRKPFIYTEWGHLDGKMFWGSAEVDKTRRQRSKTPGAALQNIRQILMISRLGFVKTTNYHIFADTQAFGIVDGYYANEDGTRAPMGYAAEAMGKLFSENSYVYDLNCLNPEYSTWFSGVNLKDTNKADAQNVEAYGFGDENGLKTVVFANMTDGDQKMSVKGVSLKPEWSYGSGDDTKLFPDYLRNKRFKTYLEPVLDVYKTDEMLLPVTYDNAAAAETITVPGNSVLIAKVEGTPETDTSYVGDRVGKLAEFQMRNSVIMKVGRNDVWADRRKTKIDESDAVYPVVVNDRTLLPLRFVAE